MFIVLQVVQLESIKLSLETEYVVDERAVVKVDGRLATATNV